MKSERKMLHDLHVIGSIQSFVGPERRIHQPYACHQSPMKHSDIQQNQLTDGSNSLLKLGASQT